MTLVLKITNPRGNIHSFSIPQFGVQTGNLDSRGGKETIQFVADKAGVFTFMCGTHTCQTKDTVIRIIQ